LYLRINGLFTAKRSACSIKWNIGCRHGDKLIPVLLIK